MSGPPYFIRRSFSKVLSVEPGLKSSKIMKVTEERETLLCLPVESPCGSFFTFDFNGCVVSPVRPLGRVSEDEVLSGELTI